MGISMNIYVHQLRKDVFGAALFANLQVRCPSAGRDIDSIESTAGDAGMIRAVIIREFCHKKTVDLTIYTWSLYHGYYMK